MGRPSLLNVYSSYRGTNSDQQPRILITFHVQGELKNKRQLGPPEYLKVGKKHQR